MKDSIKQQFLDSAAAKQKAAESMPDAVAQAVAILVGCFRKKKKVLVCGNGGSAADAQHFAAEYVNRFRAKRDPLPVIALSTDTSIMTSIANDSSFDEVFVKHVKAFGAEGDVLVVITTSDFDDTVHGHSRNLALALREAKSRKMPTIGLVSQKSKRILGLLDCALIAPHEDTQRIQEVQETTLHIITDLVEQEYLKGT